MDEARTRVHRYYQAATEDYLKYYQTDWHYHMHYGFDRDLPRGGNPTENMVLYLAKVAGITSRDRVLDAGCGVGGSALFLARTLGCRSVGITLVDSQARLAGGFAAKENSHTKFVVNDFHVPAFKPESFDVVWALESFDHAVDKAAWVQAMYAVLKPGGRLIIADGFRDLAPTSPAEASSYASFLRGWAVPHLCSFQEMEAYGVGAGFQTVHAENISADIHPHARAIFRFGLLFIPLRWVLNKFGLTSPEKLGNAYATFYQYRTLQKGLWKYGVFCFKKAA